MILEFASIWRGFSASAVSLSSSLYSTSLLLTILLFSFSLGLIKGKDGLGMQKIIRALYTSIFFYLAINLILYATGISGESKGDSMMLNALGVESSRVSFALSDGWNSYGVISGAAIVVSLLLFAHKKTRGSDIILTYGLFILGVVSVLAVDSRGALFISLLTVMIIRISLVVNSALLKYFVILLPFLPFLILLIMPMLLELSLMGIISRNPDEMFNFNGRLIIWQSALSMYDGLSLNLVLGHGMYGHYIMGVTDDVLKSMLDIGMTIEEPGDLSMHNSYLQYLVDKGIIGFIVLYSLLLGVVSKLLRLHTEYPEYKFDVLLGLVVYYITISNFEVAASIDHESFVLLVLILFVVTFVFKVKKNTSKNSMMFLVKKNKNVF